MFKDNNRNMVSIVISGLLSLRVQKAENLSEIFRKISKGSSQNFTYIIEEFK